jgi:hypothetical protein
MVFDGIAYPNPDQVALGGLHPAESHMPASSMRRSTHPSVH